MATQPIAQKLKYRNDLAAEYIRSVLHYDEETGALFWKERTGIGQYRQWNGKWAGKRADTGRVRNGHSIHARV